MTDYKAMYYLLFNRVTDAIDHLSRGNYLEARCCLMQAQQDTEELYLSCSDTATICTNAPKEQEVLSFQQWDFQ